MKVLCSVCEAAEASVLCCADEAALCTCRDSKVHAANRLARKHQRIPLLAPCAVSAVAAQECHAYFFCLEDRALLCRSCDVIVHTANAFVSAHRRFLLTGVQVGQEQEDPSPDTPEPSSLLSPPPSKGDPAPLCSEGGFSWEAEPTPAMDASSLPDCHFPKPLANPPPPSRTTPRAIPHRRHPAPRAIPHRRHPSLRRRPAPPPSRTAAIPHHAPSRTTPPSRLHRFAPPRSEPRAAVRRGRSAAPPRSEPCIASPRSERRTAEVGAPRRRGRSPAPPRSEPTPP
ncbi:hypothetical protein GUJ93_ZPchr0010g8503 [Zizania palustris]|uniref:B box-type domain-containing protein n=1 Tax=Zizania palustris TaxID=103762 RepID=A0A8J5W898_ZIZPA|nr:hypothetical protein GUJ93_ZPchr0010g8503 [Zizania palustris]